MEAYQRNPLYKFLSEFLPQFLPQDVVKKFLTKDGLATFERAFTHEKYNKNFNYQILEILGDASIKPCFISFLLKKYGINKEGVISTLVNYFLSKQIFAGFSDKYKFTKFIKMVGTPSESEKEDVFESFCGALRYVGDNQVGKYTGQMFVNMFIDWVFESVKIDPDNMLLYQNPQQILKERYFDVRKSSTTGKKAVIEWDEEKIDRTFIARVVFEGKVLGEGKAFDKDKARNEAAIDAINKEKLI
jgi:dsRNA-specific ribonuclease